eukprot:CAMPEP_0170627142 /NCGR_PEP_ID=MMETSP0224-20130122/31784_1 /TAXON_ID=285029 /ORGANISM="Togula jolla, Strain CCCM 725" /LENGTH=45 /DNA_ID= /DNA_START= /DNA_END= /DNA_ORIENTATION=
MALYGSLPSMMDRACSSHPRAEPALERASDVQLGTGVSFDDAALD